MDDDLAITQTPEVLTLSPTSKSLLLEPKDVWGRLFPMVFILEPVDLHENTFTCGRSSECNGIISPTFSRVSSISKVHFMISRDDHNLPYITDCSKNGTFLNGVLIGKGNTHILQNDDQIAMGFKSFKVYLYKTIGTQVDDFLPPDLKKKYVIGKVLGKGACGEVRLIFNKVTCRPYAVKKIIIGDTNSRRMNRPSRIDNEVDILQALDHPCVISLTESTESEDSVFIVMEYMEGGRLSDLMELPKPLSESEIKFVFFQILLGVEYLHAKGVVHRDLKPENILLSSCSDKPLIKITDFGLSKLLTNQEMMDTECGTRLYIAPEIVNSNVNVYNEKVDVWSLGVILYYMLLQDFPFNGDTDKELYANIIKGEFNAESELWNTLSDNAKDFLRKILKVNVDERLSIQEMLSHPWIDADAEMKSEVYDKINSKQATVMISDEKDLSSSNEDSIIESSQ